MAAPIVLTFVRVASRRMREEVKVVGGFFDGRLEYGFRKPSWTANSVNVRHKCFSQ